MINSCFIGSGRNSTAGEMLQELDAILEFLNEKYLIGKSVKLKIASFIACSLIILLKVL